MTPRPTRRRALQTAGTGLLTALAGCLFDSTPSRGERLTPMDGESGDAFGWDVALSAEWALVGAPAAGGDGTGAAYLFDLGGSVERRLRPEDAAGEFGVAVALDGDRALVGASATADPDIDGAVTVFERSGGSWSREARLVAPDTAASEDFGYDVALAGDRVLVGARATDYEGVTDAGVAHVFERADGVWTHRETLAPSDPSAYDYTGGSVGFTGETAVLGSFLADEPATDSGAASVFERAGGSWAEQTTLTAPDGTAGDRFGNAVAVADDRALVGAVGRGGGTDSAADAGGAYRFLRDDDGWRHIQTLQSPEDDPNAAFGVAVALEGPRGLVGAFSSDGTGTGRAVLFEGADWDQRTTLRPADGESGDGFGSSVALTPHRALVGAVSDGPGSATIFEL